MTSKANKDTDLLDYLESCTSEVANLDKAYHAVLFVFKGRVWFKSADEGLMSLKGHSSVRAAIKAHQKRNATI